MKTSRRPVFNEINITPLTDIFLVLLIIMMVVAPMLNTSGLKMAVPSVGPSADTKETPKTITLQVDAQGQYHLDNQIIPLEALSIRLREQKTSKPDGVVIEVNPASTHNALTEAMDSAQSAGITKIAVTAPKDAAPQEESATTPAG